MYSLINWPRNVRIQFYTLAWLLGNLEFKPLEWFLSSAEMEMFPLLYASMEATKPTILCKGLNWSPFSEPSSISLDVYCWRAHLDSFPSPLRKHRMILFMYLAYILLGIYIGKDIYGQMPCRIRQRVLISSFVLHERNSQETQHGLQQKRWRYSQAKPNTYDCMDISCSFLGNWRNILPSSWFIYWSFE